MGVNASTSKHGGTTTANAVNDDMVKINITANLVRELARSKSRREGVHDDEREGKESSSSFTSSSSSSLSSARLGDGRGYRRGMSGGEARTGVFAPSDALPPAPSARVFDNRGVAVVRERHPEMDIVMRESVRVGDALLKHEKRDIEALNAYVAEVESTESRAYEGAATTPCSAEASEVRACYSEHSRNVTACRAAVDAYKKCGRVALQSFVSSSAA